ncbi:6416_t:CDS:2 [Ambispora leptoticha]|uniref:6416_t:CDS:1 n=1 Tax=Ambispora leptoticha TaxID=144679 RepID=A0A9N9CBQ5_9GLOM|nr:6416_t:CDS:2 [Ambispora leptoticha]
MSTPDSNKKPKKNFAKPKSITFDPDDDGSMRLSFKYSDGCKHEIILEPHTDVFSDKMLNNGKKKLANYFLMYRSCLSNAMLKEEELRCTEKSCPLIALSKKDRQTFISQLSSHIREEHRNIISRVFSPLYGKLKSVRKQTPTNVNKPQRCYSDSAISTSSFLAGSTISMPSQSSAAGTPEILSYFDSEDFMNPSPTTRLSCPSAVSTISQYPSLAGSQETQSYFGLVHSTEPSTITQSSEIISNPSINSTTSQYSSLAGSPITTPSQSSTASTPETSYFNSENFMEPSPITQLSCPSAISTISQYPYMAGSQETPSYFGLVYSMEPSTITQSSEMISSPSINFTTSQYSSLAGSPITAPSQSSAAGTPEISSYFDSENFMEPSPIIRLSCPSAISTQSYFGLVYSMEPSTITQSSEMISSPSINSTTSQLSTSRNATLDCHSSLTNAVLKEEELRCAAQSCPLFVLSSKDKQSFISQLSSDIREEHESIIFHEFSPLYGKLKSIKKQTPTNVNKPQRCYSDSAISTSSFLAGSTISMPSQSSAAGTPEILSYFDSEDFMNPSPTTRLSCPSAVSTISQYPSLAGSQETQSYFGLVHSTEPSTITQSSEIISNPSINSTTSQYSSLAGSPITTPSQSSTASTPETSYFNSENFMEPSLIIRLSCPSVISTISQYPSLAGSQETPSYFTGLPITTPSQSSAAGTPEISSYFDSENFMEPSPITRLSCPSAISTISQYPFMADNIKPEHKFYYFTIFGSPITASSQSSVAGTPETSSYFDSENFMAKPNYSVIMLESNFCNFYNFTVSISGWFAIIF